MIGVKRAFRHFTGQKAEFFSYNDFLRNDANLEMTRMK